MELTQKILMRPMIISQYYLWGTVGFFLISNIVDEVPNIFLLFSFITLSYWSFYTGYRLVVRQIKSEIHKDSVKQFGKSRLDRFLIVLGSSYFIAWGILQLNQFGAADWLTVLNTILSPGEAYRSKFQVFDQMEGQVSRLGQILIVFSILYALFVPLLFASWRRVGFRYRAFGLIGIFVYIVSFLFIGTLKGIGDVILFSVCGMLVASAKEKISKEPQKDYSKWAIGLFLSLILSYTVISQIDRADKFGIFEARSIGNISQSFLTRVMGYNFAYGIYATLSYPSHGYLGLAYSMEQPFEFSYGAGLSQAYEGYRLQYLGGDDRVYLTYPYRSEAATGWPAGMYWSTIFPWLASDITFFLIPLFMFGMGHIFARLWISGIINNDPFVLAALGQMIIFIAFIPANNQVLMQRQGFWVVCWLITIACLKFMNRRRSYEAT